jgi:hypothetical protein
VQGGKILAAIKKIPRSLAKKGEPPRKKRAFNDIPLTGRVDYKLLIN